MPINVWGFTRRCVDTWSQIDSSPETLWVEPRYAQEDQSTRERHLENFLKTLLTIRKNPPRTEQERSSSQERLLSAFESFAESALGFDERHVEALHLREMSRVAIQFVSAARRFDPAVSDADLFQALRNVWTMGYLQLLMGLPVCLTPAIFAYSMLYPYSDNFLDDPSISEKDKRSFNDRLELRLAAEDVEASNHREQVVFRLVAMIEAQYARPSYPEVFESLLAIHGAQQRSTKLLRHDATAHEVDVLGISFEKGGCSVLADGYLVAGHLTRAQAELLFGLGTVLQLVDDLQDVRDDIRDGLMTVFSKAASGRSGGGSRSVLRTATGRLIDDVATRTFRYAAKVAQGMTHFDPQGSDPIREVAVIGITLMFTLAAGRVGEFFSKTYLEEIEAHSPFRFSFLNDCSRKYAEEGVTRPGLAQTFASFVSPDVTIPFDVEPLMG